MELYLIRHGVAEPRGDREDDDERELTAKGRRRMKRIARGLGQLGVHLDRLYHSPLARAAQTANLLRRLVDGEVVEEPRLAAAPTPALLELIGGERAGLVGHEPYLTQLLGLLTGARPDAFVLDKGGVAWLSGDRSPGEMTLVALYPARALRKIGS